jgi:hypothetical protein
MMSEWIKLDYDWNKENGRQWKLAKDNMFNLELVDEDWLTALKVTQALEK